jgi:hypothetical protein
MEKSVLDIYLKLLETFLNTMATTKGRGFK